MIYSIIRKSRNYTLGVYGNRTAACLTNHKTSKDIFVQGDDSSDLLSCLRDIESYGSHKPTEMVLDELFNTYSFN